MKDNTNKNKNKNKHLRRFKTALFVFFLVFLFVATFIFSYFMGLDDWKTFDSKTFMQKERTTVIYDKNGKEIAALFFSQNRRETSIEALSKDTVNAFIAIEDIRFYSHNGIDIKRIISSLLNDIKSFSLKEGGSTITQQLIKNTALNSGKTLERKLQEIYLALKIEREYSKSEILEMYLNTVYFGGGAYGIEAAARRYFGISASELSLSQAASLAAALKSPTKYAPHTQPENNVERRNLVLNSMLNEGFITDAQYKEAVSQPLLLNEIKPTGYPYGFYLDMVLAEAENKLNISTEELLSGGYEIKTTLDTSLQSTLESLFKDEKNFPDPASDGEIVQGAMIVLNAKDGSVAAVMGGREHTGQRILNRAVDIRRQPGSAIKPVLVYAPALESGYTASTFLLDDYVDFSGYAPSNSSGKYSGWVTVFATH